MSDNKRLVKWIGSITEEGFDRVLGEILKFQNEAPKELIEMYLCSDGGSTDVGLAFYDAIQHYKPRLVIVGSGAVGSIAPIILAAGEIRVLTEHTSLYFHNFRITNLGAEGPLERKVLLASAKDIEMQMAMYREILVTRSMGKLTRRKLWTLMECNSFISVKKAIALGFADFMADKSEFKLGK